MASHSLVEVRQLTKLFPLARSRKVLQACRDVSFSIEAGSTLGLVGESGSGKTTVGRCLAGLTELDRGQIFFKGERIDNRSPKALRSLRKYIQIVFQEPYESLNPLWSVRRTLDEPLRLHTDLTARLRRRRTEELLEVVGLGSGISSARPGELSAGDQQRVAVARALAPNPDFIVLDEPTSALPPEAKPGVLNLLRSLQDDFGLGYLFISHDLSLVRHFCDRVAVMYLGQIVEEGTRDQVLGSPRHPYSAALLSSVLHSDRRSRDQSTGDEVQLEGEIPSPIDLPTGCYLKSRCPFSKLGCEKPQELEEIPGELGHSVRCWRAARKELAWRWTPEGLVTEAFGGRAGNPGEESAEGVRAG